MLLTFIPSFTVFADTTTETAAYSGGTGTEADPYIIESAEDMEALATAVNNGTSYEGSYFKVSDDVETITLSSSVEKSYTPIGNESSTPFKGTFDGNNKTIELDFQSGTYRAIFKYVSGGTIKNVKTTGTINGSWNLASIAIQINNGAKVINCHNSANITSSGENVGGIVCSSDNSYIINCTNSGDISGAEYNIGGIVGTVYSRKAQIISCINTGAVTGKEATGGIAGEARYGEIANCVNLGTVSTTEKATLPVGGIAGLNYTSNMTIENCYYSADNNSEVCNFGYNDNKVALTDKNFAKTEEEILSEDVIDTLNFYSDKNPIDGVDTLYWELNEEGDGLAFTSEKPDFPYEITNNSSKILNVFIAAKANKTVTVSSMSDYMKISGITVTSKSGDAISVTAADDGTFTFVMPESDVTVSAEADVNLTVDGGVYQITSAADMKTLASAVNAGLDTTGKTFKVADSVDKITLSTSDGYTLIGDSDSNPFKGTFDGNNKTIELDFQGGDYLSIFKYVRGGTIKNVKTTGTINGGWYLASIAYQIDKGAKVINCHNSANITATSTAAGMVCYNSGGYIINCTNSGDISGAEYNIGGIVGVMFSANSQTISCINTGTVTGKEATGGIVGYAMYGKTANCVNLGTVSATENATLPVGGIVGRNYLSGTTIENCYYSTDNNSGVCDFGYDYDKNVLSSNNFAKVKSKILSDDVIDELNVYSDKNPIDGIDTMYWELNDSGDSLVFTSVKPDFPYEITNNSSKFINVAIASKSNKTVTVSATEDYIKLSNVTVTPTSGDAISATAADDGTFTFVMPESNVTVSAEVNANLTVDGGVYQITSAADMKTLASAVNAGLDTTGKTFKVADSVDKITLSTSDGYTPIGNESSTPFKGTFDGNNKTIELDFQGGTYMAIFNCVNGGTIKNVKTTGTINGSWRLASIAVQIDNGTKVINCHNSANITSSQERVGGIVCDSNSGYIINCTNSGDISGAEYNIGGIVGTVYSSDATVISCINTGNVSGKKSTGGIVGYIQFGKLVNCVNFGMVSATTDATLPVGGIAGQIHTAGNDIKNCYYSTDNNSGIFDFGYNYSEVALTDENFAKTKDEILSDDVIETLNVYSNNNPVSGINTLYWELNESRDGLAFTSVKPDLPYEITNNSNAIIKVDKFSRKGKTVTVSSVGDYIQIDSLTVKYTNNGETVNVEVTDQGNGVFTFEMPEANVVVSASGGIKLSKVNGVYMISSADDMKILSNAVNSGFDTERMYFRIADDAETIVLKTSEGFVPIGTKENPFMGSFNGRGHEISLELEAGEDTTPLAIFGCTKYADISNLVIKGSVDGGSDTNAISAALVGAGENTRIANVYSEASVSGYGTVGGILGNSAATSQSNLNFICNTINNGTVEQKNTAEDKKTPGIIKGSGNYTEYRNVFGNSEKNPNLNDTTSGYTAKNTSDIFADDFVLALNIYSNENGYYFWKAVEDGENNSFEMIEESPEKFYTVKTSNYIADEIIAEMPNSAVAGQKVKIELGGHSEILNYFSDIITGTKEPEVLDTKGNPVKVEKITDDIYEFVMPERNVTVNIPLEYNILQDDDGTYYISSVENILAFSAIVASGENDANAKVTNKNIEIQKWLQEDDNNRNFFNAFRYLFMIGNESVAYSGKFEGSGSTINWYGPLFGLTDGAVIKNVNISTYVINVNDFTSGGLVYVAYNSTIENCNVLLVNESGGSFYRIGGLAYYAENSLINNCNVSVYSAYYGYVYYLGGIVCDSEENIITNCNVSASGDINDFGGIVCLSHNDTIANCSLNAETYIEAANYGGIVNEAYGNTAIYNCVNNNRYEEYEEYEAKSVADYYYGAIICFADDLSKITLENNFFAECDGVYDVGYDNYNNKSLRELTDENSAVSNEDIEAFYIAAMLNEYVDSHSDLIEGVKLLNWTYDYYDNDIAEETQVIARHATSKDKKYYSIKRNGSFGDIFVDDEKTYLAKSGNVVTVKNIPNNSVVNVVDASGNSVEVLSDSGVYKFIMPDSHANISVLVDTGIEETTVIDGAVYSVIKTADDLIKAVTSVKNGNTSLNIYIANDIEITEENAKNYPEYGFDDIYNGIFDGNGCTIKFNNLEKENVATLLPIIEKKGIVKNVTVDGKIGTTSDDEDTISASISLVNMGVMVNCVNKAEITSVNASGIVFLNDGNIYNSINKGSITGEMTAGALVYDSDNGSVVLSINEGAYKATDEYGQTKFGAGSSYLNIDFTASDASDLTKAEVAAMLNNVLIELKHSMYVSGRDKIAAGIVKYWSALKNETSGEMIYADEDNAAYYIFSGQNDVDIPYKAGETVETVYAINDVPEGYELSKVSVYTDFTNENVALTPVDGKENTYTFVMPNEPCSIYSNFIATGLTKSEDGYYLVETLDDLIKVKNTVNNGNSAINIRLTADIEGYTGESIDDYSGIFDGNGHSITVDMNGDKVKGLFGTIKADGVVKNLTLKGTICGSSSYMGGIASYCYGTITSCKNYANVTNEYSDGYGGGIVAYACGGLNREVSITDCENYGEILSKQKSGGIVGYAYYATLKNCENHGNVSVLADCSGGIAGNANNSSIIDCENHGEISSGDTSAGGISGYVYNANIKNCENNGKVYAKNYYVGGIAGGGSNSDISDCKNNKNIVSDRSYSGGIIGDYYNMTIENCENNGNIECASNYAGGISGYGETSSIKNCQNNGDVTAKDTGSGGISGYSYELDIINCLNNGKVEAESYAAGIVGKVSGGLKIDNCYNSGEVSSDAYAVANYAEGSSMQSQISITNTYYLSDEDINNEVESSNIYAIYDKSEAVTKNDVADGIVVAKLNSGVSTNMKKWVLKDGNVAFGDEECQEYYYLISIDDNIDGGTVTSDKTVAKSGDKVTLLITPETEGKSYIVTGVELDENNSFVMPDGAVSISVKFGDGFAATDKEDVINLKANVKADDIVLADYVKFVNENIERDFDFKLAEGSSLPDGMKLSYGRIVGTPTAVGKYTVVIDVKDLSTVSLASLDSDVALEQAQLTLTINVEKTYNVNVVKPQNGTVTVDKEYAAASEKVTLTIEPDEGYELKEITGSYSKTMLGMSNGKEYIDFAEDYSFIMPSDNVEIIATFKEITDDGGDDGGDDGKDDGTKASIKAEKKENGDYAVKYSVPEGMSYCLICAKYENGALVDIKIIPSAEDENNGELTVKAGENVKVMLWSDLTSITPLCKVCEVK